MKILPRKRFRHIPETPPTTENPQLKLEVLDGAEIGISVSWPPGTDLAAFSQMLIWLHNGDFLKGIMREMSDYASSIGEADKAVGVQVSTLNALGRGKKSNSVVVSPRKAIKHNMRLHHG